MLIIHSCDFHALIIHKTGNYNRHTDLFSDSFFLLTYIFRSRSRSTQLIIKLDQDPTLKYFSTKYGDAAVKITQLIVLTRCDRRTDRQNDWHSVIQVLPIFRIGTKNEIMKSETIMSYPCFGFWCAALMISYLSRASFSASVINCSPRCRLRP